MELDAEFERGAPIWQGDLLGFGEWDSAPALERFGIVITADCDIQRARPQQSIVYLRVVQQADFLDVIWCREKLEKMRGDQARLTTDTINRVRRVLNSNSIDLEEVAVERWLATQAVDEISSQLTDDEKERVRLNGHLSKLNDLRTCCSRAWGAPCLEDFARITGTTKSAAYKRAYGELGQLRDDLFYISGITETADKTGYYVLLDQIGSVRIDDISESISEVRHGTKRAYRFGRLSKQFKYALAQRFALLFQRIGLPDEYNKRHSRALEGLSTVNPGDQQ